MNTEDLIEDLKKFFPASFTSESTFLKSLDAELMIDRLSKMPKDPLHLTNFNQLLHLNHEAGISSGAYKYYFQTEPKNHPYPVDKITKEMPILHERGISSPNQLLWGIKRFYIDGLLYWGDIRNAYRALRTKSFKEITEFFAAKRIQSELMQQRGPVLPFHDIPIDDRYLISEMACKAYSPAENPDTTHIEDLLLAAYKKAGRGRIRIAKLFDEQSVLAKENPNQQYMLQLAAEEFMDDEIKNETELLDRVKEIATRFKTAHDAAIQNTRLYLSIVNELDVYVATSMRRRDDFRYMARDCHVIFNDEEVKGYRARFFDPTMSAAQNHEDKGLIECLMVKCAKAVLYFAGESDSFGKDAEIAMAMSLGKPVIILCPDTRKGQQREKLFQDLHPLSRLIEFNTGVAIGAMITKDKNVAAQVLARLFSNRMEYDLSQSNGYFRLRERLTGSVVRLQTNSNLLREAFWNYYHDIP